MAEGKLLIETTIAAPRATVWQALRDPAMIDAWFGWETESLGEEIDFIFAKGAAETTPGRRLDFGEWEGSSDSFVLEDEGRGTRLSILRTGEQPEAGTYDEIVEGWVSFIAQLRLMLERHGDRRRTTYFSGNGRPGAGRLSDKLGFTLLADAPLGTEYGTSLATGDAVHGTVWHRSAFQLGLTVSQWGEGLLIVADRSVTAERADGGGYVIITTYGLDEVAFTALEKRWRDWWAAEYGA